MEKFNKNIIDIIGNTPIVKLNKICNNIKSKLYVKLEYLNPGGSIKDRMGVYICKRAQEKGEIKPGGIIIESTSGNTGVGIAIFSAIKWCFQGGGIIKEKILSKSEIFNRLSKKNNEVFIPPVDKALNLV